MIRPVSFSNISMKTAIVSVALGVFVGLAQAARTITVTNNCPFTIWSVHLTAALSSTGLSTYGGSSIGRLWVTVRPSFCLTAIDHRFTCRSTPAVEMAPALGL